MRAHAGCDRRSAAIAYFSKQPFREGYVRVRQSWSDDLPSPRTFSGAMKRSFCSCCTTDADVADPEDGRPLSAAEASSGGRGHSVAPDPAGVAPAVEQRGPKFLRLSPDNPWLVCRSPDHHGKLFWMHERTKETTWRQPLPQLRSLPTWPTIDARMRDSCFVVVDSYFFGAPADENDPKARTGICGVRPRETPLQRTCETLSSEHCLYPKKFLDAVGLRRYVMCAQQPPPRAITTPFFDAFSVNALAQVRGAAIQRAATA